MKDDKLTFKSNAKIKNFSVDDIGKLSINDVKELKNIFQPKRKTPKKEESNFKLSRDKKDILDQMGGIKSSSDHMKGYQETKNNFIGGGGGGSSIPSGLVGGRFNQPVITFDGGADRFANKSNLDDTKIKDIVNNSMNPLLDDFRKKAQDQFMQNNRQFFQGMGDITNRYIDFENSMNEKYNKLQRGPIITFQENDEYNDDEYNDDENNDETNLNLLTFDDSGNFGETKGSDNFVSNENENNDGDLKFGVLDVENNDERGKLKSEYRYFGGNDKNILESLDNQIIKDAIEELKSKYSPDYNDENYFVEDVEDEEDEKKLEELKRIYKTLGGDDVNVLNSDNIDEIKTAIDIEKNIHMTTNLYNAYKNNTITLPDAKQYYQNLGGTDPDILNAGGKGRKALNTVNQEIKKLLADLGIKVKIVTKKR